MYIYIYSKPPAVGPLGSVWAGGPPEMIITYDNIIISGGHHYSFPCGVCCGVCLRSDRKYAHTSKTFYCLGWLVYGVGG